MITWLADLIGVLLEPFEIVPIMIIQRKCSQNAFVASAITNVGGSSRCFFSSAPTDPSEVILVSPAKRLVLWGR